MRRAAIPLVCTHNIVILSEIVTHVSVSSWYAEETRSTSTSLRTILCVMLNPCVRLSSIQTHQHHADTLYSHSQIPQVCIVWCLSSWSAYQWLSSWIYNTRSPTPFGYVVFTFPNSTSLHRVMSEFVIRISVALKWLEVGYIIHTHQHHLDKLYSHPQIRMHSTALPYKLLYTKDLALMRSISVYLRVPHPCYIPCSSDSHATGGHWPSMQLCRVHECVYETNAW